MKTATLEPPTTRNKSTNDDPARATRLENARRLIRELIEEDPDFAAMVAAAASSDASDTADPEILEFRASAHVGSENGRATAARLREKFFERKRGL